MLVVTVSSQRSGTKMLSQCFKSGTVVTPFGEVFNPDVPRIGSFFEFMEARGRHLIHQGNDAVLRAYFAQFEYIHGVVAVDLMFNQLEIPTVTWNPHDHAGIYGFLRAAKAVVISLERNVFDCYVSQEYLKLRSGSAHVFSNSEALSEVTGVHTLDEADYRAFAANVERHRHALKAAMADYANFYILPYERLDAEQCIPADLRALICRAAEEQGMTLLPDRIQLFEPQIYRSGVDYSTVFSNYKTIHKIEVRKKRRKSKKNTVKTDCDQPG